MVTVVCMYCITCIVLNMKGQIAKPQEHKDEIIAVHGRSGKKSTVRIDGYCVTVQCSKMKKIAK